MRLSPVILTVVIASLAYTTPPQLAFSRLLPAAPALAAAMWPVLPTVLLGTVCLFLMIGLSLVFPDLGTWWTAAGIIAVTVAAAYGSHVRLKRERTLLQVRLVADVAQQVVLSPMPRRFGDVEIESLYLAAAAEARIGGDFYEVVDTPNGIRLLIGDVRGKGLQAVGAAAAIVNAFREAAYAETDMVDVARRLDASCTRYSAAFPPTGRWSASPPPFSPRSRTRADVSTSSTADTPAAAPEPQDSPCPRIRHPLATAQPRGADRRSLHHRHLRLRPR